MDIEITQLAKTKILEAANGFNIEPCVRLFVLSAGCSGARFDLAFDEPKQFDVMTELDGIEFVTDSEYVPKYADGLSIDYVEAPKPGYIIKSLRPINTKESSDSCGGCGKAGGCGKH
jgi:Fe-S cluster assembly iron-binding protein IscA